MNKRSLSVIIIGLFIGAILGGVIGEAFAFILPESVVKEFFLTSLSFNLGGAFGNEQGVLVLDLNIITLQFGLKMKFNFTSILGLSVSYYTLRYFR